MISSSPFLAHVLGLAVVDPPDPPDPPTAPIAQTCHLATPPCPGVERKQRPPALRPVNLRSLFPSLREEGSLSGGRSKTSPSTCRRRSYLLGLSFSRWSACATVTPSRAGSTSSHPARRPWRASASRSARLA